MFKMKAEFDFALTAELALDITRALSGCSIANRSADDPRRGGRTSPARRTREWSTGEIRLTMGALADVMREATASRPGLS